MKKILAMALVLMMVLGTLPMVFAAASDYPYVPVQNTAITWDGSLAEWDTAKKVTIAPGKGVTSADLMFSYDASYIYVGIQATCSSTPTLFRLTPSGWTYGDSATKAYADITVDANGVATLTNPQANNAACGCSAGFAGTYKDNVLTMELRYSRSLSIYSHINTLLTNAEGGTSSFIGIDLETAAGRAKLGFNMTMPKTAPAAPTAGADVLTEFTATVNGDLSEWTAAPNAVTVTGSEYIATWTAYDENNLYIAIRTLSDGWTVAGNPTATVGPQRVNVSLDLDNDGNPGEARPTDASGDRNLIMFLYMPTMATEAGVAGSQHLWGNREGYWDKAGVSVSSKLTKYGDMVLMDAEIAIPRANIQNLDNTVLKNTAEDTLSYKVWNTGIGGGAAAAESTAVKAPTFDPSAPEAAANTNFANATITADGVIEDAWGAPLAVATSGESWSGVDYMAGWASYDDNNVYFAYRALVPDTTALAGSWTTVHIDKKAENTINWSSDAAGDYLGWFNHTGEGDGSWSDYAAPWNGDDLKQDGRVMAVKVTKVAGKYLIEGEIAIPRTSAIAIDAKLKGYDAVSVPVQFGITCGSTKGNVLFTATKEATTPPSSVIPEAPAAANFAKKTTVTADGTIEEGWGDPIYVNEAPAAGVKYTAAWAAYDANNVYFAYRMVVPKTTSLAGSYTIFYMDKCLDGTLENNGQEAYGDYLGWFYHKSTAPADCTWGQYSQPYNGTDLKDEGIVEGVTVTEVGDCYVVEMEKAIPRTSAPHVDAMLKNRAAGTLKFEFRPTIGGIKDAVTANKTADPDVEKPAATNNYIQKNVTVTADGSLAEWGIPQTYVEHADGRWSAVYAAYDADTVWFAYHTITSTYTPSGGPTQGAAGTAYAFALNYDGKQTSMEGRQDTNSGGMLGHFWTSGTPTEAGAAMAWQKWDAFTIVSDATKRAATMKKIDDGLYEYVIEIGIPRANVPYIDEILKSGNGGSVYGQFWGIGAAVGCHNVFDIAVPAAEVAPDPAESANRIENVTAAIDGDLSEWGANGHQVVEGEDGQWMQSWTGYDADKMYVAFEARVNQWDAASTATISVDDITLGTVSTVDGVLTFTPADGVSATGAAKVVLEGNMFTVTAEVSLLRSAFTNVDEILSGDAAGNISYIVTVAAGECNMAINASSFKPIRVEQDEESTAPSAAGTPGAAPKPNPAPTTAPAAGKPGAASRPNPAPSFPNPRPNATRRF